MAGASDAYTERDVEVCESTPLVADRRESTGPLVSVLRSLGAESLLDMLGMKAVVMLLVSQHVIKGFTSTVTAHAEKFVYADYNVPGPQLQVYSGVTMLPWAMIPILGLISDALPIKGFNKTPYLVVAVGFGLFGCSVLGLGSRRHVSISFAVCSIFLVTLCYGMIDLLTKAKYADNLRARPEFGPSMMTFIWFGQTFAALLATLVAGWLMDTWSTQAPYKVGLVPLALLLFPVFKNYMGEKAKTAEEVAEARSKLFHRQEVGFLCVLMFGGSLLITFMGVVYNDVALNALVSVIVGVVVFAGQFLVLRPIIAKVNTYSFLQTFLSIPISGASMYFFTDGPEAYPEGPHFSRFFFVTMLGTVQAVFHLVGIYSYSSFASGWTYRRVFVVANVFGFVFSLLDAVQFARLNIALGIPDKFFLLGATCLEMAILQWKLMPGNVLIAQLCPDGMQAIVYALLIGISNLGSTISGNVGALLLEWLAIKPTGGIGDSQQFQNLWLASVITSVLGLLPVFFIHWFIPDAGQKENLLAEGDNDATKDSLLRRWLDKSSGDK